MFMVSVRLIASRKKVFVTIWDKEHDMFYTDQTGKSPHLSSKGNGYVMVGIHLDSNYIFAEARMKIGQKVKS